MKSLRKTFFIEVNHRAVVSIGVTHLFSETTVMIGFSVAKVDSQIGFNGGAVEVHISGVLGSDVWSLPETFFSYVLIILIFFVLFNNMILLHLIKFMILILKISKLYLLLKYWLFVSVLINNIITFHILNN